MPSPATSEDTSAISEEMRALIAASANVAGGEVGPARQRLAAALERGKMILGRVKEKAVEGAKATDEALHEHPYQAIGIAFGVGVLLGYLVMRRCSRNGD
jgi:ElaB/YqjD/DUF883 family membrane-anchored ribosome-binding protein